MMPEMLPCPKCGSKYPRLCRTERRRWLFPRFFVECWLCSFRVKPRISYCRAVETWNRMSKTRHR